ncbi:trypsin-like peptidase domain-containing protein [Aggregicoccus sp. 17bor-14]|uniref:S1C family serine protease n=1 Tax=Myxococcaceae TaxID=31 RepID=UPI00129CE9E1|nr:MULTISPECIES: serine protease [Myxococcaceae]MBF5044067.1 trypsin-like peptidase domain-containing protein [Simulacricoccus sp. 17bor-14]MRI89818.1 trypsin-like peptidase domain-containing protein [Aggregicoccus sp. 17bor-14]
MNRFLLGSPLLLALAACAGPSAKERAAQTSLLTPSAQRVLAEEAARPTRRELVRGILPHNVRFVVEEDGEAKRTASGVVIGSELTAHGSVSYVLTNAHALDTEGLTAPRMLVTLERQGEVHEYPAEPLAQGSVPDMDLALLRVRGLELPPAQLADDSELEPGGDVVVAASPFGKSISLSGGMVSQVEWDRALKSPRMLKTDAPIGYGASGGGVFSLETGRLLAIVEGYRTAKVGFDVAEQSYSFDVPMPGETFAAPASKVRRFLEEKGYGRLLQARPATTARR